ncbi:MAG: efflux RND transporter permease subunit [Pirellulales bacterium]|nr:efflux RND transporter permease subunit [Pirellulales bacterium]
MSVVEFALRHRKTADALYWLILLVGILAWRSLPVEVYPDISTSSAVVLVVWPGATAEQIERSVTRRIEAEIEGTRHVAWHRSESTANLARVVVRFDDGAGKSDVDSAFAALQSRVNRINDLPEGCQPPSVSRFKLDEDSPFLRICVSDKKNLGSLAVRTAVTKLKQELAAVPGVASVRLLGEGDREVRVLLDPQRMQEAGLSVPEIAVILRRSAVSIPVGSIEADKVEHPIRFVGDLKGLDQLASVIVRKDPAGAHVYLRDIARLEEGLGQDFIRARYQGNRCVVVEVTKTSGSNVMTVRDRVMERLDRFGQHSEFEGISLDVAVDITPWVSNALTALKQNLLAGCLLVLVVLCFFLGVRNSLLAMMGVPFAFLSTAIGMWAFGITANSTSVFALVLITGMLVDEEIVVLENVYRHMQLGLSRWDAIVRGMGEVTSPISAAVLTTIVVFWPLFLLEGQVGSLFYAVPVVVTIALLASMFEWLFIIPGHVYHLGPRPRMATGQATARVGPIDRFGRAFTRAYLALLASLLRVRYLTVLVLVAITAVSVAALGYIRTETLPAEFPMALVNFEADRDASLDTADQLGARLGEVLDELSGPQDVVKNYLCVAGMQFTEHMELVRQANLGMIWVQFQPTTTARRDPGALLDLLRVRIEQFREKHPSLGLEAFSVSSMGTGLEQTDAIAVRIEHSDMKVCREVAQRIRQHMSQIPGLAELRDNMREGPMEIALSTREPQASEFGLTPLDIAASVRAATEGMSAGNLYDTKLDEEVPVRVLFDRRYRDGLDDLMAIPLKTPTGAEPALGEVATPYYDQHYASVYHHDGRRLITVSAAIHGSPVDLQGRPIDMQYVNRRLSQEFPQLQREYPGLNLNFGGGYAQQQESFSSLAIAGLAALALIYLSLLIEFRSYIQPFLVLLSLAFALAGVVLGMHLHQYPISVVTGVALVGLFGVAVDNAILMIDFINQCPREGTDRLAPLLEGSRLRLRPVMCTTATTIVGLLPTAIGLGGYSSIWSPFAACFCYGLTVAAIMTLLFTPCFYLIHDDLVRFASRLFHRASHEAPQPGPLQVAGAQE